MVQYMAKSYCQIVLPRPWMLLRAAARVMLATGWPPAWLL